jgi:hypothetical protein
MTDLAHGEFEPRTCAYCGTQLRPDARHDMKYCSAKCRAAQSRALKTHAEDADVDDDTDIDDAAQEVTQSRSRRLAHVVLPVACLWSPWRSWDCP